MVTLVWLVVAAAVALGAVAYARKRVQARELERCRTLDELSAVRSPSGRRFFAGPVAKRDLARTLFPGESDRWAGGSVRSSSQM